MPVVRGRGSSPSLIPSGPVLPTVQNTPHALTRMESLGAQKQGFFIFDNGSKAHYS